MALLQGQAPEHLLAAGRLRLEHPHVSLEQLATLADPPMTKDAVAGKLRRLLALAERCAACLAPKLPLPSNCSTPPTRNAAPANLRRVTPRYPLGGAATDGH
jgi:hypothetical protein